MQKIVAAFLASLLLFPAGSFAQDFGIADTITQRPASTDSRGPLRESAIRHARLAAAKDVNQAPQNAPRNRPSVGSDVGKGILWGAVIGAAGGLVIGLACDDATYECGDATAGYAIGGAMGGAAFGALFGLIVHAARP
jgi:hypothetical protein